MPVLNWIGKEAVVNHHKEVPFRLLHDEPALSVGAPDGNLLIEGDNLEALKALLPYYAGKVKCIYIDPPYNTGNENWVYNDNVNSPQIRSWLGKVVGGDNEDLSRHDKWLCMMYPRLRLLWELLSDDGAIFVSIDDAEMAHLKVIMDEIFNRQFVDTVIWQKKYSPQNDARFFSDNHDYIVAFSKNRDTWKRNLLPRTEAQAVRYKNPDNDPRGVWKPADFSVKTYSAEYDYEITLPSGRVVQPPRGRCWQTSPKRFHELVDDHRVWFGLSGNNVPSLKKFLSEVQDGLVPKTLWLREEVGDNQEAREEVKQIFADRSQIFQTPKPTRLIEHILQIATNAGDIILDSFAGSGTTGHAVLKMNKQDNGDRRFILVEMEPTIARTITAERLKRVSGGYTWTAQDGSERHEEGLGGSFRYCTLGTTIFQPDGSIARDVTWTDLARHIWFSETHNPWPGEAQDTCLGQSSGVSFHLFFDGIGGNVFGPAQYRSLPQHEGPIVVYADTCTVGEDSLRERGVTFKQIPYDVKVS